MKYGFSSWLSLIKSEQGLMLLNRAILMFVEASHGILGFPVHDLVEHPLLPLFFFFFRTLVEHPFMFYFVSLLHTCIYDLHISTAWASIN